MDWLRVTVATTREGIEPLSGRLYMTGVQGLEIEDEDEFREFLAENKRLWDYVDEGLAEKMRGGTRVRLYLPDSAAGREQLLAVKDELRRLRETDPEGRFGALSLTADEIAEEDWAENWRRYFKPIPIGRRLLVCPEWEEVPAEDAGRVVFKVEPGMVFGTGSHESTRLCLRALEENADALLEAGPLRVLDLGCGSGILSVAAIELGAAEATAADIDPNAEKIARENARRNGVADEKYRVLIGDILSDEMQRKFGSGYGLVFANIVADVILALAPAFPRFLAPGGRLVASGIISERREEVERGLAESGLRVLSRAEENGWAALVCARRD